MQILMSGLFYKNLLTKERCNVLQSFQMLSRVENNTLWIYHIEKIIQELLKRIMQIKCLPLRLTTTSRRLQNCYGEKSLSVVEVHGLAQHLCRQGIRTKTWKTKDGDQL
jgi:hypothetical protein